MNDAQQYKPAPKGRSSQDGLSNGDGPALQAPAGILKVEYVELPAPTGIERLDSPEWKKVSKSDLAIPWRMEDFDVLDDPEYVRVETGRAILPLIVGPNVESNETRPFVGVGNEGPELFMGIGYLNDKDVLDFYSSLTKTGKSLSVEAGCQALVLADRLDHGRMLNHRDLKACLETSCSWPEKNPYRDYIEGRVGEQAVNDTCIKFMEKWVYQKIESFLKNDGFSAKTTQAFLKPVGTKVLYV